jgi:hypothetical protein
MANIIQTIQGLAQLLPLKPASDAEVAAAEKQLGLHFAEEYKEYLRAFGAILADGIELTGIAKSKSRDVIAVTIQERELNPDIPQEYYVVEDVGIDGIIIWQNESGGVFESLPQILPHKIADSLAEYLSTKS